MKEVAAHYGLVIDRGGMACCPFHEDKTPSMKVYEDHYHCFGCGEHGDATSYVARMFGLRQIDAARKLSEDFGPTFLSVTDENGEEMTLEFVDSLEYQGVTYTAFFPAPQRYNIPPCPWAGRETACFPHTRRQAVYRKYNQNVLC